jgi:hypothetical protein
MEGIIGTDLVINAEVLQKVKREINGLQKRKLLLLVKSCMRTAF